MRDWGVGSEAARDEVECWKKRRDELEAERRKWCTGYLLAVMNGNGEVPDPLETPKG